MKIKDMGNWNLNIAVGIISLTIGIGCISIESYGWATINLIAGVINIAIGIVTIDGAEDFFLKLTVIFKESHYDQE